MNKPLRSVRHDSRGFTFVELMVASTILALVVVGMVASFRQGTKIYYMDRARLMINRDIRSFTSQIDTDAVTANFFVLYPNFTTRSSGTTDLGVADGQVGDFLVLVYTDPSQTQNGVSMVTRLVGYYREVTNTTLNSGPVHRFDVQVPLTGTPGVDIKSFSAMYALVNSVVTGSASSYPIVTQLAQGLATNASNTQTTPLLFYNFHNRSVMIDTQISEALSEVGSISQTGNTYNFTVSPRG